MENGGVMERNNRIQRTGTLKTGDPVKWRGGFGTHPAQEARVVGITLMDDTATCIGNVEQIAWGLTDNRLVTVVLDNGHWAYGFQVEPVLTDAEAYAETAVRA